MHRAYADPELLARVAGRFGPEVLRDDGGLDRAALGARAFADGEGMAFLESLIHPLVREGRRCWVAAERARRPPPPLLVCEVPLLFEVGAERGFDAVLVITAGEATRRARVAARGQDFAARSARQLPEAEKLRRADRAFANDGPLEELERWVAERFAEYAGVPCRRGR